MKKLKPQDTDLLLRIMQIADSPSNLDAMQYVLFQFDFKDYEQFILECPPGSIRFNNFLRVAVFCDNLGVLVEGGGVDPEVLFELYPIPWAKMEPIVMGMRRELTWPDLFDYFEKLGKQYQKWWEPKAKKIKLPEAPKPEARPAMRPMARPTLVQATRFARPGVPVPGRPVPGRPVPGRPVPGRPGAGWVRPVARPPVPAKPARPAKPAVKKPAVKKKSASKSASSKKKKSRR